MKATVTEAPIQQVSKFPCIMKYIGKSSKMFYVLFHKYQHGVVVASENPDRPIGFYVDAWIMDYFEPVNPGTTITITA